MRQLTDRASRAGVVINTMDVRGLKAQRGVSRFTDPGNEATSALFGGATGGGAGNFRRRPNEGMFDNLALDTMSGHQGLQMLAGTLQYRFTPDNRADIDINLVIDTNNLDFKQDADGKYHATFDVVGFVINSLGKSQDGFSQTITANFSPEEYKQAQSNGISFTGHAELPPGHYQLRAVVREAETGRLGTVSQYLEVPDLAKKRLTMSSVFLYGV